MPSFHRWMGFTVLCSLVLLPVQGIANGPMGGPPPPDAPILVEHLLRHSRNLVTEINLLRGARFVIPPRAVAPLAVAPGYVRGLTNSLLMPPPFLATTLAAKEDPQSFMVGWISDGLGQQVSKLYDRLWIYSQSPNPFVPAWNYIDEGGRLVKVSAQFLYSQALLETSFSFQNTIAVNYYYIEALRRLYLVGPPMLNCPNREMLIKRLVIMENILYEMRKLMDAIRCNPWFAGFFPPNYPGVGPMIELQFRAFRIDVVSAGPQPFIPYPYFPSPVFTPRLPIQSGPGYGPMPVAAGAGPAMEYNADQWNDRWNGIDQGYQASGAPNPAYGAPPGPNMGGGQMGGAPNGPQQQGDMGAPDGVGEPFQQGGQGYSGQQSGAVNYDQRGQYGPAYNGQPAQQNVPPQQQLPQQGTQDALPWKQFDYNAIPTGQTAPAGQQQR